MGNGGRYGRALLRGQIAIDVGQEHGVVDGGHEGVLKCIGIGGRPDFGVSGGVTPQGGYLFHGEPEGLRSFDYDYIKYSKAGEHSGRPVKKRRFDTRKSARSKKHLIRGGQGRNRTTDTRIFSPYFYAEKLHYSAVNPCAGHVEDSNDYSLRLALRPLPRPACTNRLAF